MITADNSNGVYKIKELDHEHVLASFSGRQFSNDQRSDFLKANGLLSNQLFLVHQIHGDRIVKVESQERWNEMPDADGLLTDLQGVALGILTADCFPVFLYDPNRPAVGLIHAGWRGIHQRIVSKAVSAMKQNFESDPKELKIILGPAIRVCCYEVGAEFKDYFPDFYHTPSKDSIKDNPKGHVDLEGAVTSQLKEAGILENNIWDTKICTACQNNQFFSARCDHGSKERILSIIQLRP